MEGRRRQSRGLRRHGGRGFFVQGEIRAGHEPVRPSRVGLWGRIPLAHLDVAIHLAVRMAVLAGRKGEARFGATFVEGLGLTLLLHLYIGGGIRRGANGRVLIRDRARKGAKERVYVESVVQITAVDNGMANSVKQIRDKERRKREKEEKKKKNQSDWKKAIWWRRSKVEVGRRGEVDAGY